MQLDGTHILKASRDKVWELLMDPDVLANATPGVKTLELTGEDKYNALLEVKMGPVSGSFRGKMEVIDKVEPESFVLKMRVNGKIGNVSAEGKLNFAEIAVGQTEVSFSGAAKLTGTLARTGQRVLSGVAKTMTNQFFQSLEEELAKSQGIAGPPKMGFFARIKAWFARMFGKKS